MWQFGALLSQNLTPELAEACRVIKLSLSENEHPFLRIIQHLQRDLLASFSEKLRIIDKILQSDLPKEKKPSELVLVDKERLSRFT